MGDNLIKKGLVVVVIVLFIGTNFVSGLKLQLINTTFTKSSSRGNILFVGGNGSGNYSNIQDAIDNASDGDTVFVFDDSSPYYENVLINKRINLIGEDKNSTVINGKNITNTVTITAEHALISGFTITNAGESKWFYAGIRLTASNNTINGNNIINNENLGIFGKRVTNITISENNFINDSITFSLYDNESKVQSYNEQDFIHNIYNNTANGKKIYYFYKKDLKDFIINENTIAEIIAVSCTNLTITNAKLSNVDYPIILVNCSNCMIEYSNISGNKAGIIWLIHSTKNMIQHNEISNNFEGICIDIASTKNIIRYNNITNNKYYGIIIEDNSNYNKIIKNNFINNYNSFSFLKKILFGQASFIFCYKNIWRNNYWGKARVLPKLIIGNTPKSLPCINIDWIPAKKPYNI